VSHVVLLRAMKFGHTFLKWMWIFCISKTFNGDNMLSDDYELVSTDLSIKGKIIQSTYLQPKETNNY
jgi:hypothetical protein